RLAGRIGDDRVDDGVLLIRIGRGRGRRGVTPEEAVGHDEGGVARHRLDALWPVAAVSGRRRGLLAGDAEVGLGLVEGGGGAAVDRLAAWAGQVCRRAPGLAFAAGRGRRDRGHGAGAGLALAGAARTAARGRRGPATRCGGGGGAAGGGCAAGGGGGGTARR